MAVAAGGPATHCHGVVRLDRGRTPSGYVIAGYIALCAVVSIIATLLMPDHTNKDISQDTAHECAAGVPRQRATHSLALLLLSAAHRQRVLSVPRTFFIPAPMLGKGVAVV